MIAIKNKKFDRAQKYIDKCRYLIDQRITSLIGESYS
ncbi:MAG: hypothetical protein IPK55_11960 [Streptococcus sp.]|nr:hypothetical protein [Streptococcus sp.]